MLAGTLATSASAALFFLFSPTAALPGDVVKVRLGGTPAGFTPAQRERPFQRPIRIYLVQDGVAGDVRSRFDPRLHFVGALVPDRNARGMLAFEAPPLDSGTYVVAAWCPGCARFSAGSSFFTSPLPDQDKSRQHASVSALYPAGPRRATLARSIARAAAASCPRRSGVSHRVN